MTKKYLEFNTHVEAQTRLDALNTSLGYPLPTGEPTHSTIIYNPSDNTAIFLVCLKCHEHLTPSEIDSLKKATGDNSLDKYFPWRNS